MAGEGQVEVSVTVTNMLWEDAKNSEKRLQRRLSKADVSSSALAPFGLEAPTQRVLDHGIAESLRGAVIDAGKLVALRSGKVLAKAELLLNGTVLLEGEHSCLAGVLVDLGGGIELLVQPRSSPGPSPTSPTWVHRATKQTTPAGPVPAQPGAP
jgi:hypothetical protein